MPNLTSHVDAELIYCGDCLEQLPRLPDASVELVYIDPPFNSNQNYEVFWGETKEKRAFVDRHASTQAYIQFMRPRCVEFARVLKDTGSFVYHCDWHASHYVKVMLDQIFGENGFRNEIVWHYCGAGGKAVANQFPRNHDVLFWYTKADKHTYIRQYVDRRYTISEARELATFRKGEDGRWFTIGPRGNYTDESIKQLRKEGRIHETRNGAIGVKYFLEERNGKIIQKTLVGDVWDDILSASHMGSKERLGYPTQKPIALLDRIISAMTKKGEIVLDAFCGSGTALIAAHRLRRKWIGIDISPTACRVMASRLRDEGLQEGEEAWKAGRGFIVRDLPSTVNQLRRISPFEFENWAVIALGGIANRVKVGDMAVDGRIYPVSAPPDKGDAKAPRLSFMDRWYPIQVKQKDKVGCPDIDAFEAMMVREECTKGFFVAFDYSHDATTEIARFFRQTGKVIIPLTVKDILDKQTALELA